MTLLNLPNTELQRMIDKMATEIKNLKGQNEELAEKVLKLEWAVQIARDEAAVNAKLLSQRQLRLVGGGK